MILWAILGISTLALIAIVFLIYIGYYLYIARAVRKKPEGPTNTEFKTRISVIVPTFNDAGTINDKLLNLVEQSYPTNLMEILLIDSNSQDETVSTARNFLLTHPDVNMKIVVENERKGKSEAINKALSAIDPESEIVVMTDANAFLKKDALQKAVSRFSFPIIGAVVGRQIIPSTDQSKEAISEANYLSFYQKMREGESIIDSTPIFDGELSAYRTSVIKGKKIREDLNADDSQLAVIVRREGYKAVIESEAIFYESLPDDKRSQRMQKARRGQGLARLFWYNKNMMFRPSFGKFGYLISPVNFFMHVVSPFLLLAIVFLVAMSILFYVYQSGQFTPLLFFLVLAIIGWLIEKMMPARIRIYSLALTFIQYQLILLEGIVQHLRGKSLYKWQKVSRKA
jgi:cellulose synthase/poly-beta-1,6-N-acetylglucosamine synthase-like glycosyltransferase